MKTLNYFILIIGIIGALNWGIIGLFNMNIVASLFGTNALVTRIIYILVGISGIYMVSFFPKVVHERRR